MEIDWDLFQKPLILAGVCLVSVAIVFCANKLPEMASSAEEGQNRVVGPFVWLVIGTVTVLGAALLFYVFKSKSV